MNTAKDRKAWCFLLAIAAAVAAVSAESPTTCETASECSLNGECVSGECVCDAAWSGPACSILQLLPSVRGAGTCDPSLNGTATGYTTTWGGHPVQDSGGLWHLHAAEMANHCGMCAWSSQSQVAQYVSSSGVLGPYVRNSTAVGAFAHNPTVIAVPSTSLVAPESFLLFHIGIGCDSAGVHECNYTHMPSCENGTTPKVTHTSPERVPTPPGLSRARMHVASALGGPWLPAPTNWTVPYCSNNPAPVFLRNGSMMIACHSPFSGQHACTIGTALATSATADWATGPWTMMCLNVTNAHHVDPTTNISYSPANEDPHLYVDQRGALHILTHNQSPCYSNVSWYGADVRGCGGHFYSSDNGASWSFSWHAVYNGTVLYTDGAVHTYKRERPKVVQNAAGEIIALATGIGVELLDAFAAGDDAACTLVAAVATAPAHKKATAATLVTFNARALAPPACRSPLTWPFDAETVWNVPLGSAAVYSDAGIYADTVPSEGVFSDDDYFVVTRPGDPLTPWRDQGHWNATPNCLEFPWAPSLPPVPWPTNFTITAGGNNALALLLPDGDSLVLTQPAYKCAPDAPLLSLHDKWHGTGSMRGSGNWGGHGGSALNAIGGSLRIGELLPSSTTPPLHVLKLQLWARDYYYGTAFGANKSTCYHWPALCCDGYSNDPAQYGGSNPLLTPGALLAIEPSRLATVTAALTTAPAKALAWTLAHYGGLLCDDTYADRLTFNTEHGFTAAFESAYGFPFVVRAHDPRPGAAAWLADVVTLFRALAIVENNTPATPGGGGTPLQPPPPPFCTF